MLEIERTVEITRLANEKLEQRYKELGLNFHPLAISLETAKAVLAAAQELGIIKSVYVEPEQPQREK